MLTAQPRSGRLVFVTATVTERVSKLAFALRKHGFETTLICHSVKGEQLISGAFTAQYQIKSVKPVTEIIRSIRPGVVFFSGDVVDDLAAATYSSGFPIVYSYKDVLHGNYSFLDQTTAAQYDTQYFLIKRANGVLARDEQLSSCFITNKIKLRKPRLFLPDYCWSKDLLPKVANGEPASGDLKSPIAVISGFFNSERQKPFWSGTGQLSVIRALLEQGIRVRHFPVYHSNNLDLHDYHSLMTQYAGQYEIRKPVSPIAFMEQIKDADFAVILQQFYQFPEHFSRAPTSFQHSRRSFSSRCSEYLGAGLPLVFDDYSRQGYLAEKIGIGIRLAPGDVSRLRDRATSETLIKLRNKVSCARNGVLNIDTHVPRLVKWLNAVQVRL